MRISDKEILDRLWFIAPTHKEIIHEQLGSRYTRLEIDTKLASLQDRGSITKDSLSRYTRI